MIVRLRHHARRAGTTSTWSPEHRRVWALPVYAYARREPPSLHRRTGTPALHLVAHSTPAHPHVLAGRANHPAVDVPRSGGSASTPPAPADPRWLPFGAPLLPVQISRHDRKLCYNGRGSGCAAARLFCPLALAPAIVCRWTISPLDTGEVVDVASEPADDPV